MRDRYYKDKLYPLMDRVLATLEGLGSPFYLTGGTALSRAYLQHRYSDDLDLFSNGIPDFKHEAQAVVTALKAVLPVTVSTATESFVRLFVQVEELVLKVDIANDIQVHFGELTAAPFFGRIDGWRNILSNKICALTRSEVKDIVDILCLAGNYGFEWEEILDEARQKDLWVEPLGVSRLLQSFPAQRLGDVRWIAPMDPALLQAALRQMHHDLFHGQPNSLQGRYSQWVRSDTASS